MSQYLLAKNSKFLVAAWTPITILFDLCLLERHLLFRLFRWLSSRLLTATLRVPLRCHFSRLTCSSTLITLHTLLTGELRLHVCHVLLEIVTVACLRLHLLLVLGCRMACFVWNIWQSLLLHLLMGNSDRLHLWCNCGLELILLSLGLGRDWCLVWVQCWQPDLLVRTIEVLSMLAWSLLLCAKNRRRLIRCIHVISLTAWFQ